MANRVRVYMVTKTNGKQDILNRAGVIPKTVAKVHIAWGNGKGDKVAEIDRETFLATFKHVEGCEWELVEVEAAAATEETTETAEAVEEVETAEVAEVTEEVAPVAQSAKLARLKKEHAKAEADARKWMERRRALGAGATRAKVTTANARWAQAAEYRDLLAKQIAELEAAN
jgi:hypothetical protein